MQGKRLLLGITWLLLQSESVFASEQIVSIPLSSGLYIEGAFFVPDGGQKFPAIVALHGCSGLRTKSGRLKARERYWAGVLNDAGYAVLFPDSFTTRGFRTICQLSPRPIHPNKERVQDAYAALAWLEKQDNIQADNVVLMGWSNGGMTTLWALSDQQPFARSMPFSHGFKVGIAFYPGCYRIHRDLPNYRLMTPLLLQLGVEDTWTPAKYCVQFAKGIRERWAGPVDWDVYDDARHGFDDPEGKRRTIVTRNEEYTSGQKIVTIGPDPQARDKSVRRVLDWLGKHIPPISAKE